MIERRHLLLGGLAGLIAPAAHGQGGGGPGGQGGNPGGPAGQDRIGDRANDPRGGYLPQQSIDVPLQPQPPRIRAFVVSQSYRSTPAYTLANTTRDAALIARSFQQLNLDAVSALVDADPAQTMAGIASYLRTIDENTIAMVYVAGHGLEIGGENLLMLEGGTDFLSLQALVQALRERAGIAVLFLDACRNNPLAGPPPEQAQVARSIGSTRDGVRLQTANIEELRARAGGAAGRIRPFTLQGSGIRIDLFHRSRQRRLRRRQRQPQRPVRRGAGPLHPSADEPGRHRLADHGRSAPRHPAAAIALEPGLDRPADLLVGPSPPAAVAAERLDLADQSVDILWRDDARRPRIRRDALDHRREHLAAEFDEMTDSGRGHRLDALAPADHAGDLLEQ